LPPHALILCFFFLVTRRPPTSPLFPYTTLFRSIPLRRPLSPGVPIEIPSKPLGRLIPCHCLSTQAPIMRLTATVAGNKSPQGFRSEEHTSELQSLTNIVCRLLLEKKKSHTDHSSRPARTVEPANILQS